MPQVALHSREGRWVMVSTILASAMAFIDGTALNVALPALQEGLGATGPQLFWILNAYLLMLASLILIGGSLGDKLGRKKVFMWGILIFVIGSAMCGMAPNVWLLIVFRMIQGIGGALMIPGSLSLISSSITEKQRGKAIGTWSSVTTLVTVGGPILGGALADAGLWRFIFFINVPIGLVTLLFLWRHVEEIKDEDNNKHLDIAGAVTMAAGLALLTFCFLRMPALGLAHWHIYSSLIGGLLLLTAFIFIEKKSPRPMMPLHLFAGNTFLGVNLLTFFLYAGLGAGMLFLGLNLVQVQGYSQLQSGLTFLPFTVMMILLARYAGTLADRYGPQLFLIAGPAVAGVGLFLLSLVQQTRGPQDYWHTFFPGVLVFGLGMAFTVAPLTSTVMGAVSDRYAGTASGVNNAITRVSNVFANAVFGALAVWLFAGSLLQRTDEWQLDHRVRQNVLAEAANLGNAKVPAGVGQDMHAAILQAYHQGFIHAYSYIMMLSAGLCFAGALMSALFIRNTAIKGGHHQATP